jgi:2',3'-cyclic-nucleotide 2'-phosphodiesterase / 3'-nucleotidase
MRYQIGIFLLSSLAATSVAAAPAAGTRATLAVLETTDLHSNVVGYDYYKLSPDASLGLDRAATLIAQARREFPNTLLLDNGDTIQGTALADYQALAAPLACDSTLAIYRAMNHLGYDGGGIGNHEFNYGLAYLSQVTGSQFVVDGVDPARPRCAGPAFPQVLSNVISLKTGQPLFAPYHIIDKELDAVGADGKPVKAKVRIGIIGFAPPAIMAWDKRWLEGKVRAEGVRESAIKYIPEMKAKGADLIVAISHGGLDAGPYTPSMENANWHLAQVPGIDVMLMGHSHQAFPNASASATQFDLPGVDKVRGFVHGVPTVMANLWGKHVGVIGLQLAFDGAHWTVDKARTTVEARSTQLADKSYVAPDAAVVALVAKEHEATIGFVKTPLGATAFRMSSYFADVGDVSAIEVVNLAQLAYVRKFLNANLPDLAGLPLLSVAAPFKSGTAGPRDYTDVQAGSIALNNAADLYLYPNVLNAVKVNGAELKAWLEHAARRFNTIDPRARAPQELVNREFPSYNFDAPTQADVRYEIDLAHAPGKRIVNLRYRGKKVRAADQFIVVTNSYRANGGGDFPGLNGSKTVIASPDTNREALVNYVKQEKTLNRSVHAEQRSWRFKPMKTAGPVVFHAPPGMTGLAQESGLRNVAEIKPDDGAGRGMALYQVKLLP